MSAKDTDDADPDHSEASAAAGQSPLDGSAPVQASQNEPPSGLDLHPLSLHREAGSTDAAIDLYLTAQRDWPATQSYGTPPTTNGGTTSSFPALTQAALHRHDLQLRLHEWAIAHGAVCNDAGDCPVHKDRSEWLFDRRPRSVPAESTHRTCNESSMEHSINTMDHWDLAGPHDNSDVAQNAAQLPPQLSEQEVHADRHSLAGSGAQFELQEHVGDYEQDLNIEVDEEETP
jgi:hypothetical protein